MAGSCGHVLTFIQRPTRSASAAAFRGMQSPREPG